MEPSHAWTTVNCGRLAKTLGSIEEGWTKTGVRVAVKVRVGGAELRPLGGGAEGT